jgi:hypothetical protein|tara:strand:+ start:176 stop:280 length:105 start_codon:yes stop_codon:yes gene_type:complete
VQLEMLDPLDPQELVLAAVVEEAHNNLKYKKWVI